MPSAGGPIDPRICAHGSGYAGGIDGFSQIDAQAQWERGAGSLTEDAVPVRSPLSRAYGA
jgi:hypothetical protein